MEVERFHAETETEDVIELSLAIQEIHQSLKARPYGIEAYDELDTPEKIENHLMAGYDIDTFEATYCISTESFRRRLLQSQLKG
jgi:hypothetical protein